MKKSKNLVVDFEKEKKAYKAQFCCEEFRILCEENGSPLEFNEEENVWKIEVTHWLSGHNCPRWRTLKYCFNCGRKPKLKEPVPHVFIHEIIKK